MGTFKRATKERAFLRLALDGPSGSGKTFTALTLATALMAAQPAAERKPIAVVDTERGSASKYSDLFQFDVLELANFHPQKYIEAIQAAAREGYGVIILDSLTHAWEGPGGILEIVQRNGNGFAAWAKVAPIERAMIDALTGSPIHVIATMRTKADYVVEKDEQTGKQTPRKVGTKAIQRDGLEYEFDVAGRLDQENTLTITKTRCMALTGAVIPKPGAAVAETLAAWLSTGGAADEPPQAAVPAPAPAPLPPTPAPVPDEPTPEDESLFDGAIPDDEPVAAPVAPAAQGKKAALPMGQRIAAPQAQHDLAKELATSGLFRDGEAIDAWVKPIVGRPVRYERLKVGSSGITDIEIGQVRTNLQQAIREQHTPASLEELPVGAQRGN